MHALREVERVYKLGNDRNWVSDYQGKEELCAAIGLEFWWGDDHDQIVLKLLRTLPAAVRWVVEMRTGVWCGRHYPMDWKWLGQTSCGGTATDAETLYASGIALLRAEALSQGYELAEAKVTVRVTEHRPGGFARPDQRQRFKILKRDGYRCQLCGRTQEESPLEVDHKIALARGGTNDEENLWVLCQDCNRGKGTESL